MLGDADVGADAADFSAADACAGQAGHRPRSNLIKNGGTSTTDP